jgi:hypothetical protein
MAGVSNGRRWMQWPACATEERKDNVAGSANGVTAETFLQTGQHNFGNAWRYGLIDGEIVAHAAPSPDHGVIPMGLGTTFGNPATESHRDCQHHAPITPASHAKRFSVTWLCLGGSR